MLAHFGHHLMMALLTPLLPYIRNDFSLTYTQVGWLVLAYNLTYGLSQLPGGWLADRLGPRIMLTIGVAGVAVVGLLIGLSQTYIILALFLVLLGIAGGGYHPSASPLVSASVEPKHRGRALGIHQIGGTGSFFLAPLIAAGIASFLDWRGTFVVLSIPVIAFGIVFYVLLGRLGYTRKAKQAVASDDTATLPAPGHLRRMVVFVILGIASMVLTYSVISFIPLYIVDHFKASEELGAAMLSLAFFGGLWAGPLGGYLSDRLGRVPVILAVGLIAGPAIYLLNIAPLGVGLSVLLVIMGMAMHLGMPVVEAYLISHTSARRRSTALGIYYLGSRGGPAIAPAIGYLIDNYGFNTTFSIVGATMMAVTLVGALFLWGSRE
ncbi:MAG: MFS transporter [Dehalococcoidales bacterium]